MDDRRHVIVVDLGFGDAGKGATVDWLCAAGLPDVSAVVRCNGGAQAGHNVVTDTESDTHTGGVHHTFQQFGAGTFSGVPTFLSQHVLVEPIALAAEVRALEATGVRDPLRLLSIDAAALLTTPVHVAANRAREDARGDRRHGSCGKGIGETVWYALGHDAPRVGDCADPDRLRTKLGAVAHTYDALVRGSGHDIPTVEGMVELYREFAAAVRIVGPGHLADLAERGSLVFEGAQGVLLDEWRGFHPHTTWSTVEPSNARRLLAEIGASAYTLGVARTYLTRHGAGPFPTEDPTLLPYLPEPHNGTDGYQGAFRVGHLDPLLLRYAIAAAGGIDGLALTHLDRIGIARTAVGYRNGDRSVAAIPLGRWQDLGHQEALTRLLAHCEPILADLPTTPAEVVSWVAEALRTPVVATADGPARSDRAWRQREDQRATTPPVAPPLVTR